MDTITISKHEFMEKSAEATADMLCKATDLDAISAAINILLISPLLTAKIAQKLFDEADPEAELAEAVKGEEE